MTINYFNCITCVYLVPKDSLKECVFVSSALKLQCHIVISAILPTRSGVLFDGHSYSLEANCKGAPVCKSSKLSPPIYYHPLLFNDFIKNLIRFFWHG